MLQSALAKWNVRLEETPGLCISTWQSGLLLYFYYCSFVAVLRADPLAPCSFLNDVERIATRHYQPTDADVIRARLRTLGVQEYKFVFDHGALHFLYFPPSLSKRPPS